MKKFIVATLFLPILVLAACSSFTQATATPTSTSVLVPTATLAPTAIPLLPTETPDVVSALAPQGQPASDWNGIPVMPGATAGEGDEEGYVFAIQATPQQVQEYYVVELGKLGWQLLAQGKGDASSLILMFTNNTSETLSVSILTKGQESLVLLVK